MTKTDIIEKAKELINAPSCYAGLKNVANDWIKAVGTADEKDAAEKFIAELEADVQPIDEVIGLFSSDAGKKIVGEEAAANMVAHFKEVKAKGGKWCDCPACTPGRVILDNKSVIL
ncbi:MAG: heat-shock protein Hsp90 [Selenomonadaceae bacterium]|nr:heat-shock protein Hsp90 [Selenomonadaceae bacterium]